MTRFRYTVAYWLAGGVAAACIGYPRPVAAEPLDTTSIPVRGEQVDPNTPVTYRLPVVGIFDPPQVRVALRSDASTQTRANTCNPERSDGSSEPGGEILRSAQNDKSSAPNDTNAAKRDTNAAQNDTNLATAALAFPPSAAELTSQLLPAVQRGYNLAQRGAFFAARTEFVQVLRRVAQAKDAGSDTDEHSRALAAGLRALDEAADFVPQGVQLEAELDVRAVASSHRTPVLNGYPEDVMPQEAVAQYHSYAQQQLANAAAGEQAGSMALYGLGKVYARLAERRDDDVQFTRGAMTMYAAALDACPDNHMAANELGVLLCRAGHPAEAVHQFERTIDLAPNATAYHNLAVAQQKLGLPGQAAANENESQRLAALERSAGAISRRAGVQWVSPAEMARATQPASPSPVVSTPATAARPLTTGRSQWR